MNKELQTGLCNISIMENYRITKNGKVLVSGLTKTQAIEKLFPTVENFSNGYIYDNEANTIYHEVDGKVIAKIGDESVRAGDNYFEIEEDND
jgi:hypothetical protein